jgi:thioredoxin reductase/ferredoxin
MPSLLTRYARWLHTGWPAGRVEPLPVVGPEGRTNVPGLRIAGELAGVPLLKFALDSGVRAVRAMHAEVAGGTRPGSPPLELVILGAGVAGMAGAIEASRLGMRFEVIEAAEPFFTIANFPRAKPIFTYPRAMRPEGALQVAATVKEPLLEELREQARRAGVSVTTCRVDRIVRANGALRVELADGTHRITRGVLVALGRNGDFHKLGVPGEALEKVFNRLHDPGDFAGRDVAVVGGGDSALEAAIALAEAGARTTLVHRGEGFPRARAENAARLESLAARGALMVLQHTQLSAIEPREVVLDTTGRPEARLANDAVFVLTGREPSLPFLREAGVRIAGEGTRRGTIALALAFVALALFADWKSSGFLETLWSKWAWPANAARLLAGAGPWWAAQVADRATLAGTIAVSMQGRSFYYTVIYTAIVGIFGLQRIRRRRTPYVTRQTLTLFLVQAIPLFILPEIVLPWLGYNGAFDHGWSKSVADRLFESYIPAADYAARHWPEWGHPRAYWRAYGFVLAWPLDVYNVFTHEPLWAWIGIGFVQTFVIIPLAVLRWGKGAYCGWICSCGALAETLGDTQRSKMPHGPGWNRVNLLGQVFLALAFALLALRIAAWALPGSGLGSLFDLLFEGRGGSGRLVNPLGYKWLVDVLFAGVIGLVFYFRLSGRVWCRFACPLAALMHVYARFSRFAIVPDKKKCISCNVCTSVCHQGIDVMSFANRGRPMQDPQCVRCSACVEGCPTGTLQFGSVSREGALISVDSLMASPVLAREGRP